MSYRKSKYFTTPSGQKIKYLMLNKKSQITLVFFHGFMSDMMGAKPIAIQKFCQKQKLNFLKFEYSGHGKSTGKFIKGNISKWVNESRLLIKKKVQKNNNLIFIGSSMGSWIALKLLKSFKNQIKGFLGIASAPEFLHELMWKKFDTKIKKKIGNKKTYYLDYGGFVYPLTKQLIFDGRKNKIFNKKIYNLERDEFVYPITKQLIFDGRKNKVLNNKINLKIPIILFHGTKDNVVPLSFSRKILKFCKKSNKKLIRIKNGDHSLSRKNDLKKICKELNKIIKLQSI